MEIKLAIDNVFLTFDPKPDITPLESARFTQFMVCMTQPYSHANKEGINAFLEEHGLLRHFKPCDPVSL